MEKKKISTAGETRTRDPSAISAATALTSHSRGPERDSSIYLEAQVHLHLESTWNGCVGAAEQGKR